MRTLAIDGNNDLFIDKTGNISVIDGIRATAQTSRNFAQTRTGEMIFSIDRGIPFFLVAFDRFPNLAQFEAAIRRRLLEIETIESISALNVQFIDGAVKYTADIITIDGAVTING